jgi:hypothetical protein
MKGKKILVLAAVAAALLVVGPALATVYNFANDFATGSNPNSVWTYGEHNWTFFEAWGDAQDWTKQLENVDGTGNYMKWSKGGNGMNGIIYKNVSAGTITTPNPDVTPAWALPLGNFSIAAGSAGVLTNQGGDGISSLNAYGKGIRFKAQSAGDYVVHAVFTDQTTSANTSAISVFNNWVAYGDPSSNSVWSDTINNSSKVSTTYDHTFTLAAGGSLDFMAGGQGPWTFTGMDITITSADVPEPGSLLALGSGLFGLIGFGIRRKRA